MAASNVQIANIALSHIGSEARIASLTEDSEEARHANLLFAPVRDQVLRGHAWRFATKYVTLADLGSPPSHWSYRYAYPSDCMVALNIVTASEDDDPIEFEIAANDNLDGKVVLTDTETAELKYIAKVTNPTVFDPLFSSALAWLLASQIAAPLTGDQKKQQSAFETYQRVMSAAMASDANEGHKDYYRDADWIQARA